MLIADESTTALDATIQSDIIDLLGELQTQLGMAVIMITHDLGIVVHTARRILVMYTGKIVESGFSEDIFYRPQHPYTQALLRAVPRLDLKEDQELASIQGVPFKFEFEEGHFADCWLYHPLASLEKELVLGFMNGQRAGCFLKEKTSII